MHLSRQKTKLCAGKSNTATCTISCKSVNRTSSFTPMIDNVDSDRPRAVMNESLATPTRPDFDVVRLQFAIPITSVVPLVMGKKPLPVHRLKVHMRRPTQSRSRYPLSAMEVVGDGLHAVHVHGTPVAGPSW